MVKIGLIFFQTYRGVWQLKFNVGEKEGQNLLILYIRAVKIPIFILVYVWISAIIAVTIILVALLLCCHYFWRRRSVKAKLNALAKVGGVKVEGQVEVDDMVAKR